LGLGIIFVIRSNDPCTLGLQEHISLIIMHV
jgi:hypothetical protein